MSEILIYPSIGLLLLGAASYPPGIMKEVFKEKYGNRLADPQTILLIMLVAMVVWPTLILRFLAAVVTGK